MAIVYNENRVWVRITNFCNSNCIFCLDWNQKHLKEKIEKLTVFKKIKEWFKKNYKNKLIISWWEASTNENFMDYIRYWKKIWYYKIQTFE